MARKYSVEAGCFRWPLQVFYNILDLTAINAWIFYEECTGSKISRKEFIFSLADELAGENKENIRHSSDVSDQAHSTSGVRKSCQEDYCNKNKSSNCCMYCKNIVCGKCTKEIQYVCKKCPR